LLPHHIEIVDMSLEKMGLGPVSRATQGTLPSPGNRSLDMKMKIMVEVET